MPKPPKPFAAGDWTIDDASTFKAGTAIFPEFHFPFVTLDQTPGGNNLGRIEWCVELIHQRNTRKKHPRIIGIAVWARQTRDPRYQGRMFYIPCHMDALTSSRFGDEDHFMHHVWHVAFCAIHHEPIFAAYPKTTHSKLVLRLGSSISGEIVFQ